MGFPPADALAGPSFVTEAASRLFFDVTVALRSSVGRTVLTQILAQAEAHAAAIFQQLVRDPRLALRPTSRVQLVRTIVRVLIRTRIPWYLLQTLLWPATAHRRFLRLTRLLANSAPAKA